MFQQDLGIEWVDGCLQFPDLAKDTEDDQPEEAVGDAQEQRHQEPDSKLLFQKRNAWFPKRSDLAPKRGKVQIFYWPCKVIDVVVSKIAIPGIKLLHIEELQKCTTPADILRVKKKCKRRTIAPLFGIYIITLH